MARLTSNERGVVYVEFLIAFFPQFLLFLALCQLALIASAETVVRHAAYAAVRSAVVVLDDEPARFDQADRGSLSQGRASQLPGLDAVVSKLGIAHVAVQDDEGAWSPAQRGTRMVPIRTAALLALLPLAPNQSLVDQQSDSIISALGSSSDRQLGFAVGYTKDAAVVSIHDSEDSEALALDPIGPKSTVTVRITYLYHCAIPFVRAMMCRSLGSMSNKGNLVLSTAYQTSHVMRDSARFKLLTATATLPNQGADYLSRGAE